MASRNLPGNEQSMKLLRAEGWDVDVVERWLAYAVPPRRKDCFGVADLLAFKQGEKHLLVQTTTLAQVGTHLRKILAEPRALGWLRSGGRLVIHGWHRVPVGMRRPWRAQVTEVTEEMFK